MPLRKSIKIRRAVASNESGWEAPAASTAEAADGCDGVEESGQRDLRTFRWSRKLVQYSKRAFGLVPIIRVDIDAAQASPALRRRS